METDWEMGKPPYRLRIDVFVLGHVRRGWSDGSHFVFEDCTFPEQNMIIPVEMVTHWRATAGSKPVRFEGYVLNKF